MSFGKESVHMGTRAQDLIKVIPSLVDSLQTEEHTA